MHRSHCLVPVAAVLVVACGGLGAESRPAFSPARVISQETENGATPMFLSMPDGSRVVAWVSAAGGGSDEACTCRSRLPGPPARSRP
jgi:hypothetical protein